MSEPSTKPYLLRAIHEWCSDSGFTPYIAVSVDEHTRVPQDFVRAGEIVLNVSTAATNRLVMGNERIEFQARFGGRAQELSVPIENVSAIYARENGHGLAFDVPKALALVPGDDTQSSADGSAHDIGDDAGADAARQRASLHEDGASAARPGGPRAPLTVAGKRDRPHLSAVPDLPGDAPADTASADGPAPDDPSSPIADNGGGDRAGRVKGPDKPRGRPTLTRIK